MHIITIKSRRGLSSDFCKNNPVLDSDEYGFEIDTNKVKRGDGKTRWNSLCYYNGIIGCNIITGGYICK